MSRLIAALFVFAIACAPASGGTASAPGPSRVGVERTLCVLDKSAAYGAIKVRVANGPTFNPWSGEIECKPVYVPAYLLVTSNGGGLAGPLRERMVFKTTDGLCMVWVIMGQKNRYGDGEQRFVPCSWRPR